MLRALTRGLKHGIRKEQLTMSWYLLSSPPTQKTLLVTGPVGTGKSTLLQAFTPAYQVPPLSNYHLHIQLQPQPKEEGNAEPEEDKTLHSVNVVLAAVTNFLEQLEESELSPAMEAVLDEALLGGVKQLVWRMEDPLSLPEDEYDAKEITQSRQEMLQEYLTKSNFILAEAKSPLRLSALSEADLTAVVKQCPASLSFQILSLGIMASGREENPGELLAPLIVNIANSLGKELLAQDPSLLPLLVVMESIQLFCYDPAAVHFLTNFLKALLKSQEHFHCVLEGSAVTSEPFKIIMNNPDKFIWAQVFELTRSEFEDYASARKVKLSESDKEKIWKLCKGTQTVITGALNAVEEGKSVSEICQSYMNGMVNSMNKHFTHHGMPEVPNSASIMHIQKMELAELRATVYFLSHLILSDKEIEMTVEDFQANCVAQHVCLSQLCYYNSETKRMRIENAMLHQGLLESKMWKVLAAPTQHFKNKACYEKVLLKGAAKVNEVS
jgi:hypothetical protein